MNNKRWIFFNLNIVDDDYETGDESKRSHVAGSTVNQQVYTNSMNSLDYYSILSPISGQSRFYH